MAKWTSSLVLDGMLDKVATATTMLVCSAQPTDRANALTVALADVAMAPADYTKANGDVSGRKVTMAQKANVPIDTSGTASHIALIDGTNLLYVTTCTEQVLTAGGTVTFPQWKVEIGSPS